MKRDTNSISDVTEAQCLASLVKAGKKILIPFGSAEDYDYVIEENEQFLRVQCKTGQLNNGIIKIRTYSMSRDGTRRDYKGRTDLFAAYCRELDKTYLLPVDIGPSKMISLRIDPPKNNQKKRIRWARDYEI